MNIYVYLSLFLSILNVINTICCILFPILTPVLPHSALHIMFVFFFMFLLLLFAVQTLLCYNLWDCLPPLRTFKFSDLFQETICMIIIYVKVFKLSIVLQHHKIG